MKAWSLVLSKEISVTKEGDHYIDQDGNLWNDFELACLHEDTDWQQVRIQASIAAMQAHISDGEHMALISRNLKHDDNEITKFIAKGSVMYADALVKELKKGGQYETN